MGGCPQAVQVADARGGPGPGGATTSAVVGEEELVDRVLLRYSAPGVAANIQAQTKPAGGVSG